jgi:4-hydroxybenzoate polyprenyltransferase
MIRSIGTKGVAILALYACAHVALNVRVAKVLVLMEMAAPSPTLTTLLPPMHPFPAMDERGKLPSLKMKQNVSRETFLKSSTTMKTTTYLKLARLHRPHGIWLLLFPAWWGIAVASPHSPPFYSLALFLIGAILMRSAGCVYNDIIDRNFDAQVRRTATRPLPAGKVSLKSAFFFLIMLLGLALLILLSLPSPVIITGFIALGLVLLYPWMKRLTYWPQLFLGITFNIGIIMGWLSLVPALTVVPLLFYGGGILWTLGYDTIYALQDREDDLLVGVKSSAIRVSSFLKLFLAVCYGGAVALWSLGGKLAYLAEFYWFFLAIIALQFAWQILTLKEKDTTNCLKRFQSNSIVGLLLFLAIVFSKVMD